MKHALIATSAALVISLAGCKGADVKDAASDAAKTTTDAVKSVTSAAGEQLCEGFGPQTPRDIASIAGVNTVTFPMAPSASEMNLCNIHTHTNAEHKGPGFSVFVNDSDSGGYACNDTDSLTEAELAAPSSSEFGGAKPGDTLEVHWVHTSCDIEPGAGLGSCLSDTCQDPLLRVEAQVYLLVNDAKAANFMDYAYGGNTVGGKHQAKALPDGTGTPVKFLGSTTGPSYTEAVCSPMKVTWNVRPQCTKLDINSLNEWAKSGNVFEEKKSHGVRQLVTAPELLSPIK